MGRSVDLTGVQTEFPVIEPGDYVATITKGEYREAGTAKAKNAKHDMENVEFTIKHSLEDEDVTSAGRKVFKNFSLGPESLWSWKRFAISAGIDPDDLEGPIDPEEATNECIGNDVIIKVDTRQWNDQTMNDVKDVRALEDF